MPRAPWSLAAHGPPLTHSAERALLRLALRLELFEHGRSARVAVGRERSQLEDGLVRVWERARVRVRSRVRVRVRVRVRALLPLS